MADFTQKGGVCKNCKVETRAILHLHFRENGARGFMWICSRCNKRAPFGGDMFIANETVERYLTEEQIEALPKIMPSFYGRCVVCGARGAEMHHWAPRAIFGKDECEQWPKDFLCKSCHDLWHQKVTPSYDRPDTTSNG